jgi:glycine dehydrogenase subunit 1
MRYLPHTKEIREKMLKEIGVDTIDDLFVDVPKSAVLKDLIDLPMHKSEAEVEQDFLKLKAKNLEAGQVACFLGAGAYRHHIPAAVDHLIQRGEFLTSYTPYQPEISQGTLQYLFEFQTQVCLLTGMEVANASMYDGATSTLEAVMMANRITKRNKAVISGNLHPHYAEVINTYAHFSKFDVVHLDAAPENDEKISVPTDASCVVVQYPDFFGHVNDFTKLAAECHAKGVLLIVAFTEVVALGLLKPIGEMGADIVVGEGQSLGVGLNFGGPTVGLFATKKEFVRQMPGRVAGQTVDSTGKRGWVLTLSTREQHIRRDKATSNICTNSGLCALAFTIHVTLLGELGFKRLAKLNHAKAIKLHDALAKVKGVQILNKTFFNEFVISLPSNASEFVDNLVEKKIFAGVPVSRLHHGKFENLLLVACTEMVTDEQIELFASNLKF